MTKVASLGMYDHPAQRAANDALWAAIADALRVQGVSDAPDTLDRSRPVQEIWRDPDLLFAQICGYPMLNDASLSLQVLAVPRYDAPGCVQDTHRSFIIVRADDSGVRLADYRRHRAAINDRGSNTGMNLFRAAVAEVADGAPFFDSVTETGSHRASVAAVAGGAADIAAIDAVTFAALQRFEPELISDVRILTQTVPSPTLPLVTACATASDTVAALRIALNQALAEPRDGLFLTGVSPATDDRFAPLLALERHAADLGYSDLR